MRFVDPFGQDSPEAISRLFLHGPFHKADGLSRLHDSTVEIASVDCGPRATKFHETRPVAVRVHEVITDLQEVDLLTNERAYGSDPIVPGDLDAEFLDSSIGCPSPDFDTWPQLHRHGENAACSVFFQLL